ncbi:hypothetical protein V2J09_003804 [Rumex salicifolius]
MTFHKLQRRIHRDDTKCTPWLRAPSSFNTPSSSELNNNSLSGEIPRELSKLPNLLHFLLDNNNLSGSLPAEFSELPKLQILQLDNNNFNGSEIPASYGNMSRLLKL